MSANPIDVNGIRFTEVYPSRDASQDLEGDDEQTLAWQAYGTNDSNDIAAAFAQVFPLISPLGYVLRRLSRNSIGHLTWDCRADYVEETAHERDKKLDEGEFKFSFDTAGGSVKQQFSDPADVTKYGGSSATDFKGAINVNKGRVEGVDRGLSILKLSLTYRHPAATITQAYLDLLVDLYETRNEQGWFGFSALRLLFKGASGSDGTNAPTELTYNFEVDKDLTNLTYGSITGVDKPPHDYLWVDYAPTEDTVAGSLRPEPRGVYVHKIFPAVDYSQFQLNV